MRRSPKGEGQPAQRARQARPAEPVPVGHELRVRTHSERPGGLQLGAFGQDAGGDVAPLGEPHRAFPLEHEQHRAAPRPPPLRGLLDHRPGVDGAGLDRALAREVEQALTGPRYREFLANLYGDAPDRWDDALAGWDRLRVIVNAMTRLRFCTR